MKTKKDLAALLAREHLANAPQGLFFNFGSDQDFADSSRSLLLPLPAGWACRTATTTPRLTRSQRRFGRSIWSHVQKMLQLLGDPPDAAKREAATIMQIETALAKASLTRVEQRDPHNLFHKMDRKQLQALTPDFDWDTYLKVGGIGQVKHLQRDRAKVLSGS